jgi:hypothetical protein
MKRLRNIIGTTFLLVGIAILFSQQSSISEIYQPGTSYSETKSRPGDYTPSQHTAGSAEDAQLLDSFRPEPSAPIPNLPDDTGLIETPLTDDHPPLFNLPVFAHSPEPPPADITQPTAAPLISPPVLEVEFPFQKDLALDLPVDTLKEFSNRPPHNYNPDGPQTYVYATFMATRNPSLKDPYYMAIHSLIYRILWSSRSRTEIYPFIVFVGEFVTPEQRQLLRGAGAIVRELAPLEWNPNVPGVQARWKDLFAKLNMWNQTDFSRILFLDADAFPTTNIDAMFDVAALKTCNEAKLHLDDVFLDGTNACEPYIFAGVPQNPFNQSDINVNVGSMVFTPSSRMHMRLLQNYAKTDRYNCLMAEQAFLNWQFDVNGAFPATALERRWGGFFPQEDEKGKLNVVHEKLWAEKKGWLAEEWDEQWRDMLAFYGSTAFGEKRRADSRVE